MLRSMLQAMLTNEHDHIFGQIGISLNSCMAEVYVLAKTSLVNA